MITLDRIVVVEGKYDRIKLSGILDATVVQTDGFGIFKNEELKKTLRVLAKKRGLVILTDSDSAGFAIRNHIINLVGAENVVNAYIPDITGKEKRKAHPSAEGTLGVEGVGEETILAALERAGVTASRTQRKKYLTKTDFYLLGLSGGEKQRISIARAVLMNPSILVFDEATAAVDSETENQIQTAIERLISGRTTLMIAHRLSTLRKANKIIVVDNGKIIECGSHDELMALKGKFYRLIKIQSMSEEVEKNKAAEKFE